MKIRASGEDYLEGIFVLQKKHDTVRSVDLARHMEVSKASVSHAVSVLRKAGLLVMNSDYSLRLTDTGHELAKQIYERHCFFMQRLISAGVDPETAEIEACRMEHTLSQESFELIQKAYSSKKSDIK